MPRNKKRELKHRIQQRKNKERKIRRKEEAKIEAVASEVLDELTGQNQIRIIGGSTPATAVWTNVTHSGWVNAKKPRDPWVDLKRVG